MYVFALLKNILVSLPFLLPPFSSFLSMGAAFEAILPLEGLLENLKNCIIMTSIGIQPHLAHWCAAIKLHSPNTSQLQGKVVNLT